MKSWFIYLAWGLMILVVGGGGQAHASSDDFIPSDDYLGRGINLGNFLEAPREGDWGRTLTEDDFSIIKQAGFVTIRVPIRWSAHIAATPPYTIDPIFLARVDWVVAQAEKNGLIVILDYHNDDALMAQPDVFGPRFLAIWKQVAEHFQNAPPSVCLELLNEPKDKMDDAH